MIKIDGAKICVDQLPYMITGLSINHGGSIRHANFAISCSTESGASAVKIQTYTPETMKY